MSSSAKFISYCITLGISMTSRGAEPPHRQNLRIHRLSANSQVKPVYSQVLKTCEYAGFCDNSKTALFRKLRHSKSNSTSHFTSLYQFLRSFNVYFPRCRYRVQSNAIDRIFRYYVLLHVSCRARARRKVARARSRLASRRSPNLSIRRFCRRRCWSVELCLCLDFMGLMTD